MEMRGVEFHARRFVVVEQAVDEAAPVRFQPVILRRVGQGQPLLDFRINVDCGYGSRSFRLEMENGKPE